MIPLREKREFMLFNRIPVVVQANTTYDIPSVISAVQARIPSILLSDLDYVLITNADHLEDRDLDSVFLDGVIYLSGDIEGGTKEATLTVIHEIAHSVEEIYPQIYEDESIEAEFLGKRKKLYEILHSQGFDLSGIDFFNAEYSAKFDDFLYLIVGYPLLRTLSSGLFLSPYAATSIREYFADAFEEYFMRESKHVKLISPAVYFKLEQLLDKLGETSL